VGLDRAGVRGYFEFRGFVIREWDRMTTDRLSIESPGLPELPASA